MMLPGMSINSFYSFREPSAKIVFYENVILQKKNILFKYILIYVREELSVQQSLRNKIRLRKERLKIARFLNDDEDTEDIVGQ